MLEQLGNIFRSVKTHGFRLVSLDSRTKDGGVFVNFTYNAEKGNNAIKEIVNELRAETSAKGGIPSWTGIKQTPCNIWEVEGTPWREVSAMPRFQSYKSCDNIDWVRISIGLLPPC